MATTFCGHPHKQASTEVIKVTVIIKLKLWQAAGCEAKVVAKLSSCPLGSFAHINLKASETYNHKLTNSVNQGIS